MAMMLLSFLSHFWVLLISFVLITCQQLGQGSCSAIIESIPGFEGKLPFVLETGYIGVGSSEDVQLFYYFVKSESDPEEDPLILWLTGGPGCSSFSAVVYEIGPLAFHTTKGDGSMPTLGLNPNSWTKVANIIFLDLPVGTGFSYSATSDGSYSTDLQACEQAHEFLRKWLIDHPVFISNSVYVGGDSYSGITVPIVTHLTLNGNEEGMQPLVNLKGYVIGNPITNSHLEDNYKVVFAHRMGLISDELYESLQGSCGREYSRIDPSNTKCVQYNEEYIKCTKGINRAHILEPACGYSSQRPGEILDKIRSRDAKIELFLPESSPCPVQRVVDLALAQSWLNYDIVREALHIRKGSIGEWIRCNYRLNYHITTMNSFNYHVNLSTKGLRSLVYSGDHDMVVPNVGTQAWIRSLNYSIVDDWRSWIVEGQVAGYTRTYSNGMTFVTVKGGGHIAAEQKPEECSVMFQRWIANQPL